MLTRENGSIDAEAILTEAAEELVALTEAEWDEFVAGLPSSGSSITTGDGEAGPTATTIETSGVDSPFPDPVAASHYLEGQFNEGPKFQFYVREGRDQICWRFERQDEVSCDHPDGDLGVEGENANQPRIAVSPDGATALVYAALPPNAADVQVTAVGQRGQVEPPLIIGERIWVAELPSGYGAVDVTYLDADGNVIAQASMS